MKSIISIFDNLTKYQEIKLQKMYTWHSKDISRNKIVNSGECLDTQEK